MAYSSHLFLCVSRTNEAVIRATLFSHILSWVCFKKREFNATSLALGFLKALTAKCGCCSVFAFPNTFLSCQLSKELTPYGTCTWYPGRILSSQQPCKVVIDQRSFSDLRSPVGIRRIQNLPSPNSRSKQRPVAPLSESLVMWSDPALVHGKVGLESKVLF